MCFFFKQKTAYEMRISDWSSDVCSSDLQVACGLVPSTFLKQLLDVPLQPAISLATNFGYSQHAKRQRPGLPHLSARHAHQLQAPSAQLTNDAICMRDGRQIGRASSRARGWKNV